MTLPHTADQATADITAMLRGQRGPAAQDIAAAVIGEAWMNGGLDDPVTLLTSIVRRATNRLTALILDHPEIVENPQVEAGVDALRTLLLPSSAQDGAPMTPPASVLAHVPNPIGLAIVGSQAYGLTTPTSDVDRLGTYIEPTERFLGLRPPVAKQASKVKHGGEHDVQWHEVGKLLSLVLSGNPTVTELLWVDDDLVEIHDDATYGVLRHYRARFLSRQRIRDAYFGYAQAQFDRLARRGKFASDVANRPEKHARHLLRLIEQGLHAYEYGEIRLRVDDPARFFQFGHACTVSVEPARRVLAAAEEKFDSIVSPLPEQPDTDLANDLLVEFRRAYMSVR